MGGYQNYGPSSCPLNISVNIRYRVILGTPKGTIILDNHPYAWAIQGASFSLLWGLRIQHIDALAFCGKRERSPVPVGAYHTPL